MWRSTSPSRRWSSRASCPRSRAYPERQKIMVKGGVLQDYGEWPKAGIKQVSLETGHRQGAGVMGSGPKQGSSRWEEAHKRGATRGCTVRTRGELLVQPPKTATWSAEVGLATGPRGYMPWGCVPMGLYAMGMCAVVLYAMRLCALGLRVVFAGPAADDDGHGRCGPCGPHHGPRVCGGPPRGGPRGRHPREAPPPLP